MTFLKTNRKRLLLYFLHNMRLTHCYNCRRILILKLVALYIDIIIIIKSVSLALSGLSLAQTAETLDRA